MVPRCAVRCGCILNVGFAFCLREHTHAAADGISVSGAFSVFCFSFFLCCKSGFALYFSRNKFRSLERKVEL